MTAPLAPTLLRVIDQLLPELIDFRRDLHAHPEISFQEHRTTARLRERLDAAMASVAAPTGDLAELTAKRDALLALA